MQNLFTFLISAGVVFIFIVAAMFLYMKRAQKRLNADTKKTRADAAKDMAGAPADQPDAEK